MKGKSSLLAILIIALSLAFIAPGHARSINAQTVEGTIQTLDLKARHATPLTTKGKIISFHWNAIVEFTTATPLRKGASVAVKYHEVQIGENYVTRIEVRSAARQRFASPEILQRHTSLGHRVESSWGFCHPLHLSDLCVAFQRLGWPAPQKLIEAL